MQERLIQSWRRTVAFSLTVSLTVMTFGLAQINVSAQELAGSKAAVLQSESHLDPMRGAKQDNIPAAQTASPEVVFNGTGTGPIPDSAAGPQAPGTPLVVNIPVTGLTGNVTAVTATMTFGPQIHTWAGDVVATLRAPGGSPSLVLFGYTGAVTATSFGDNSDLTGPYTFSDAGTGTNAFWAAATAAGATVPIPSGTYKASTIGGTAAGGTDVSINTAFAGLTPAQANGTWTLTFTDGGAGDTGSVSAVSLDITAGTPPPAADAPVDMNGDGKTDYVVVRNTGGGVGGQITWYIQNNGGTSRGAAWGISTDFFIPEDYNGDGSDDVAVWRPGATAGAQSNFYVLQSGTNTFLSAQFGQNGDDPTVVNDYDGDNKADFAVYRVGATAGAPSFWYYRPSGTAGVNFTTVQWGQNGDFPAPGDYDGDNKNDFCVQRNVGGAGTFLLSKSGGGTESVQFGLPTDVIVPGDYDGDRKTDFAVRRAIGGQINWFVLLRAGGNQNYVYGASATDTAVQGDYNGDGKTDVAVWRSGAAATFFVRPSGTTGASDISFVWGQTSDYPVANYNNH